MKTKLFKRSISILCILALLVTVCIPMMGVSAATLTPSETGEAMTLEELTGFTVLTAEDFGITEEVIYNDPNAGTRPDLKEGLSGSWDKTVLRAGIKFSTSPSDRIFLGNQNWCGFYLWGSGTDICYGTWLWDSNLGEDVVTEGVITPDEVNKTTLTDVMLDIAVSFEVLTKDSTNGSMRVGIFIDGKLCENGFFTISGINTTEDYLSRGLFCYGGGVGLSIAPVKIPNITIDDMIGAGFTKVTFSDFNYQAGYSDTTAVPVIGSTTIKGSRAFGISKASGGWDKYLLYGDIKFSASDGERILFSAFTNEGFYLWGNGTGLDYGYINGINASHQQLGTITPADAKKTSLTGEWLDFAISFEVVTEDSGSYTNDGTIKVGIFIDGNLLNNQFITIRNASTDHLASRNMDINCLYGNDSISICAKDWDESIYTKADTITLSHFDIDDQEGYSVAGGAPHGYYEKSLLDYKVAMELDFSPGDVMNFGTASGETWEALQFDWISDENLGITAVSTNTGMFAYMNRDSADLTSFSDKFKLEILAKAADFDLDGTQDDLVLRCWFDGELYQSGPYYLHGENSENQIMSKNVQTGLAFHHYSGDPISFWSVLATEDSEGDSTLVIDGNYIDITQADFDFAGIQGTEVRSDISGESGTIRADLTAGLNGTRLNMDVLFPNSPEAKLYYGTTEETNGLAIYADGEGNLILYDTIQEEQIAVITPEQADAILVGERINVKISYANQNNDALVRLWINDKMCNEEPYTITGLGAGLGNSIKTIGNENTVITTWMPLASKAPNAEFGQITFENFNISDNMGTSMSGTYSGSLVNSVFTARCRFWSGNYFSYAGIKNNDFGWNGFQFSIADENNIHLSYIGKDFSEFIATLSSEVAGTLFTGQDIILSVSLEATDSDRDGVANDVALGLFFNGKLYNNRYFYLSKADVNYPKDMIQPNIGIHCSGGDNIRFYSVEDWRQEICLPIAPSDFGITDGMYNEAVSGNLRDAVNSERLIDMNGKLLSTDVIIRDGGFIMFGGNNDASGIVLSRENDKLYLELEMEGATTKTELDWTSSMQSLNKAFNLKVSMAYVEHDESCSGSDDVQIRIWFNDVFGGEYYADNSIDSLRGYLTISEVDITSEEQNIPKDYLEYTFEDFGLDYVVYDKDAVGQADVASDEIIFADRLFIENNAVITIGGYTISMVDDILSLSKDTVDFLETQVSASDNFSFAFVQNMVDADNDGMKDDVRLSVYIDGTMYNNRYFYFLDSDIDGTCVITNNEGSVTLSELNELPIMPFDIEENIEGYILPTDKDSITVNGTEYENTEINTVGDYRITYISNGDKVSHRVAVYKAGDANADGERDVKDIIRIKKAEESKASLTKSGKYGADLNNDRKVTKEDTAWLRTALLQGVEMVKEENDKTVFGVISDTHFVDSNQGHREENLKKALSYYRENGAKLIIMNGDVSDLGTVASYQELVRVIREIYPDEQYMPQIISTADNHEYYDAWEWLSPTDTYDGVKLRFMEYLAKPLGQEEINTHLVLDGYHFISFSAATSSAGGTNHGTAGYDKEWLAEQLATAVAEDASKPIFVSIHQPPKNTVVNSINDELTELLSEYPQIILFTSHTHSSMKLETNIHQKDYTTVNTSSMYYVSSDGQGYANANSDGYVPNCYDIGEGFLVTVDKQQVAIQRYDFFNGEQIKTDWIVNIPQDGEDFKDLFTYTDERSADAPMFTEDAFAIVKQTGDSTVSIRFDSAIHEDFVYYYKITVYNAETNELVKSAKYANDFFLGIDRMSKNQEYIVDGLTSGVSYRFEITAVETFGSESTPLTVNFSY